jgi:hypothetical protein
MQEAITRDTRRRNYEVLPPVLEERSRPQWAAAEAWELGGGGIFALAAAGLARDTIRAGLAELRECAEQQARNPAEAHLVEPT